MNRWKSKIVDEQSQVITQIQILIPICLLQQKHKSYMCWSLTGKNTIYVFVVKTMRRNIIYELSRCDCSSIFFPSHLFMMKKGELWHYFVIQISHRFRFKILSATGLFFSSETPLHIWRTDSTILFYTIIQIYVLVVTNTWD